MAKPVNESVLICSAAFQWGSLLSIAGWILCLIRQFTLASLWQFIQVGFTEKKKTNKMTSPQSETEAFFAQCCVTKVLLECR